MSLKKLGTAILAVLVVGAVVANSASAAATTTRAEWYTGSGTGTTLAVGTDLPITAAIKSGTVFTLKSIIGTKPIELTATGLECVGCNITNAEVTSKAGAAAMGKGKIKFTGVTAMTPSGCTIRNGSKTGAVETVETKALQVHADWMNEAGTIAYQQFFPETAGSEVFATIYIQGTGECESIQGSYNVTGTVFSQAANATGVGAVSQENTFSPAIQTATGGALKLGANAAEFSGSGVFTLENHAEYNVH
jgi:hypothetical protein